jgi:TldD protein
MTSPLVIAEDASRILREAVRCGGDWAELFMERRENQTVRLDGGSVAEIRSDRDVGAGVRVIADGRTGFAYTNVLSRVALLEAAQAATAATVIGETSGKSVDRVDLRVREVPDVQRAVQPATEVETAEIVQLLRRVDSAARSTSSCVDNVTVTHVAVTQSVTLATTDGLLTSDTRVRTRLTCRVTARRDGRLETGFCGPGAGTGIELYLERSPESIGSEAADRAVTALDGGEPPGGALTVVLGSSGGGLLLHEACGHGLEGDGLSRNTSIFARTQGARVGSRLVTAIDDPSRDLAYGSYGCDDEGTVSSPTTLLDGGVQVGGMTDRATARILGFADSGNGRRESYAHPPLPRMSNTYIAPGTDDPAAIIGAVRHGVYVVAFKGGDVDITTGQFGFSASEAYLIENGEVTRPLAGLTLLGNGPAAMASIEGVGNDLSFTQALCGKDEQWVPVSYGSPTLLVTGLTVTGRRP